MGSIASHFNMTVRAVRHALGSRGGAMSLSGRLACPGASGEFISVYLTNQIGPGTTVANEIAFTSISPADFLQTERLFTGLSLGAGSYYLVLAAPTTICRDKHHFAPWRRSCP